MSLLSMQKTVFKDLQCTVKFQQQGYNTYYDLPKKSYKKSATLNESCPKCLELEKRVTRDEKVGMEWIQKLLHLQALLLRHEDQLSLLEKKFAAVGKLCISHEYRLPALEEKCLQLTKLLDDLMLDFTRVQVSILENGDNIQKLQKDFGGMLGNVNRLEKSNEDATNSINSFVKKNKDLCARIDLMQMCINTPVPFNKEVVVLFLVLLGCIGLQQYQIYVLGSMLKV